MSSSPVFAGNAGLNESPNFPLRVVERTDATPEYRKALRPGEDWKDSAGRLRELPRYFYEVPSWDSAMKSSWEGIPALGVHPGRRTGGPAPKDFPPVTFRAQ